MDEELSNKYRKLVFLGGTAGSNDWRDSFTAICERNGVPREVWFNPVVKDWDDAAQAREETAKEAATHLVFCIANPRQDGNPLSAYSMVEATMALYDKPERTVVVFDYHGMRGHPLKAMVQAHDVLRSRFPSARIFDSPVRAMHWLIADLTGGGPSPAAPGATERT